MAVSDVSALPAKAATSTIPIVFISGNNPVDFGLVRSLNRPGENVTGVTTLNVEMAAKRLELLHQVVPTATSIAALINPTDPTPPSPFKGATNGGQYARAETPHS